MFKELEQYGCEGLRPLSNYIITQKVDRPETTPGGIILPDKEQADSRKDTFPFFEVLAVGPDLKGDTVGKIEVGDYVVFQHSIRMQLPDGFELWVLPENQVLALVSKPRKAGVALLPVAPIGTHDTSASAVS